MFLFDRFLILVALYIIPLFTVVVAETGFVPVSVVSDPQGPETTPEYDDSSAPDGFGPQNFQDPENLSGEADPLTFHPYKPSPSTFGVTTTVPGSKILPYMATPSSTHHYLVYPPGYGFSQLSKAYMLPTAFSKTETMTTIEPTSSLEVKTTSTSSSTTQNSSSSGSSSSSSSSPTPRKTETAETPQPQSIGIKTSQPLPIGFIPVIILSFILNI